MRRGLIRGSTRLGVPYRCSACQAGARGPKAVVLLSFALACVALHPGPLLAAGTLRGFVTDSTTGEPITFANVMVRGTAAGATTNIRGYYYVASVPPGDQTVVVSCVGYRRKTLTVRIEDGETTHLDVLLAATGIELEEFLIIRERSARQNETDIGLQKITSREIQMQPPAIESDMLRVLQATPGVSSTGDVTSKYYVRGGGTDQNLLLVNGAPVYNPFHALGVLSVVDPEMISSLEFQKGGFTPEYGGRLSSILSVVTKDGNKNNYHGVAQASLLSGKLAVEGPIPGGSIIVTGRKSYQKQILSRYLGQDAPFDFYDLSFKVNYANPAIDENSRVILHGFLSGDAVDYEDLYQEDYHVKNNILGLNWHKVWSSPLYSSVSMSFSGFDAEVFPNLSRAKARGNTVQDFNVDWDFAYVYDSRDEMRFGLQTKRLLTRLQMENLYGVRRSYDENGWDINAYTDYRFYRWDAFGMTIGLRMKLQALTHKRPFLFEPRLSLTYWLTRSVAFKAAAGWYSQELTTLSNEDELISVFEPWIIIPEYLGSSQAAHYIVGLKAYVTDEFTIETEGYYKPMRDLIDVNEKKYTARDPDYVNVNGESFGVEVLLKAQPSRFFVQTSYSLSWAYRYAGGRQYTPRYDSRHSLSILVGLDIGAGWSANGIWSLRSGLPFTPIAGFYDRLDVDPNYPSAVGNPYEPVVYWGTRNSGRLPVYHRLDLSMSKRFRISGADVTLGASVINVYDRINIFYFDRDTAKRVNMLRFSPSVLLKVEL